MRHVGSWNTALAVVYAHFWSSVKVKASDCNSSRQTKQALKLSWWPNCVLINTTSAVFGQQFFRSPVTMSSLQVSLCFFAQKNTKINWLSDCKKQPQNCNIKAKCDMIYILLCKHVLQLLCCSFMMQGLIVVRSVLWCFFFKLRDMLFKLRTESNLKAKTWVDFWEYLAASEQRKWQKYCSWLFPFIKTFSAVGLGPSDIPVEINGLQRQSCTTAEPLEVIQFR